MATASAPVRRHTPQLTQPARTTAHHINVGEAERLASIVGGGTLTLYGLSRGTLGGLALAAVGGCLVYRGASGHCTMFDALGINTAEPQRGERSSMPARAGVKIEKSITINRPAEELYRLWRDFSNLPRFMSHLESVQVTGPKHSHWVAHGPMGARAEWDAEIITERQNELIGWRSLEGSVVDTAGSVHFVPAPGNRGTELRVSLKYNPPAGKVGAAVAWLFGESGGQQVEDDLRRFKAQIETGTVPTIEGQPQGRCRW